LGGGGGGGGVSRGGGGGRGGGGWVLGKRQLVPEVVEQGHDVGRGLVTYRVRRMDYREEGTLGQFSFKQEEEADQVSSK